MVDYVLNVEGGKYTYNGSDIELSYQRISEVIDQISNIPIDAKKAVKDFIYNFLEDGVELEKDLIVNIPESLAQYSDSILDAIKLIFGC